MGEHPYRHYPNRSFWSRSVVRDFDPKGLITADGPLLRHGESVASMGSCFASNLVPYIEQAGFEYVRTEEPHPQLAELPENLGYRDFSAAYGNLYTVRQMVQLIKRCTGAFSPANDRWYEEDAVVDPFRPGLAYPAVSDSEFDAIARSHLRATREAFARADVVVVTLGLTEAWVSTVDGAVYPACPGTVAGTFDPERHTFHNFSTSEVVSDLTELIAAIRTIKPRTRFILTVSPVPLVATASGRHVLEATTYSKSVLRVAAAEVADAERSVTYFPAYEIVTGSQAPANFFEDDRRNVSEAAIGCVMQTFVAACELADTRASEVKVRSDTLERGNRFALLSRRIVQAECEEELADDLTQAPV
jgi:hypothetical protein